MTDPRGGPGGRGPTIILRPNRDPKGRKIFFGDWLPPTPSKGLEDLDPPLLSQGLDLALLCTYQCKPRGGGGGGGECGQGGGI